MRRLIVCCDGTWKTGTDAVTTNVVKLAESIKPIDADGVSQIVHYVKGVGSGNKLDSFFGGTFGKGLETYIIDAYRFLVLNYQPGDEIFLFGYSRGAYVARSTAGMIRTCGIVPKARPHVLSEAFDVYRAPDVEGKKADNKVAVEFRERVGAVVPDIHCLGVWDTVGALGVPVGRVLRALTQKKHGFHDTGLSAKVKNAFHALAIDEKRYTFEPSLWTHIPEPHQRVEQKWFAGVHSDVGGGYVETGLSDFGFAWMVQCASECGLEFYDEALAVKGNVHENMHRESILRLEALDNIREVLCHEPWGLSIHESAIERMNAVSGYRPINLVAAVEKKPLKRPFYIDWLRWLFGAKAVYDIVQKAMEEQASRTPPVLTGDIPRLKVTGDAGVKPKPATTPPPGAAPRP